MEEKEKLGETYVPEERSWPTITEKPFLSKPRKYVVCLDTMGQDREFTEKEKRFALETVKAFAAIWERREQENLTKDRNMRLQMIELDKEYNETVQQKLQDDEDEYIKEHINSIMHPRTASNSQLQANQEENQSEPPRAPTPPVIDHPYAKMDEEERDFYQRNLRLKFIATHFFENEYFKKFFQLFVQFTVIKYPRIWQSLFYLIGCEREEVCESRTNKLKWKVGKKLAVVDLLADKMWKYEALGEKKNEYKVYQTLNFIEKNIEQYHPDDVDVYSSTILGRLLRWMLSAIKLRRQDIIRRRSLQKKAFDKREEAIQREAKRKERSDQELKDAEARFNEEHREEIEACLAYRER